MSKLSSVSLAFVCSWLTCEFGSAQSQPLWQSTARLHETAAERLSHNFTHPHRNRQVHMGTLIIDTDGVKFHSAGDMSLQWRYVEIQTLDLLLPRRLVVKSYANRGWFRPGEKEFRFDLDEAVPPGMARELARRIEKPVRNGEPEPERAAFAEIPARHGTRFGGSNGTVRFGDEGIDYLTATAGDARSWRWPDIQTLANPDPYSLRIAGYRETFDFKLKWPLSRQLFDRLWDKVYTQDLKGLQITSGKEDK